ncbi:hypothetical protein ABT030_16735 [Streptomyces mirabilis]|uniref:hypothetical protein n=1 Tax=Streptomyces mirabilis TaxID=68239 RepID=UPI0033347F09
MDELPVHQGWLRQRWRSVAVLGAVFALAGGGALYAELRPVFPRTDARACSDSTVPLAEQAEAVAPALPEHATDLRYDTARLHPRAGTPTGTTGRTVLRMEFRATSADIQRWLTANRVPKPTDFDTWGGPEALGATCGVLEDGFSDWQTTNGRLAATVTIPYGLRLIVNIDPDSRPRPAVLVTLEEA